MMGRTIAEHSSEGAELSRVGSEKLQCRAAARKVSKVIRSCRAKTKAIKKLDDEQKEFLERMRKRF